MKAARCETHDMIPEWCAGCLGQVGFFETSPRKPDVYE